MPSIEQSETQKGREDAGGGGLRQQLHDLGVPPELVARVFPDATGDDWLRSVFDLGTVTVSRRQTGPPRVKGRRSKPVVSTEPAPEHPRGRRKLPWKLFRRLKKR